MLKNIICTIKSYTTNLGSNSNDVTDEKIRENLYLGAKSGNKEDQYGYACFCFLGEGGPVNVGHVEYWLNMAANQGQIDAQAALGDFYFRGDFLEKNLEKAKYWLIVAATNDHEGAKYYVDNHI